MTLTVEDGTGLPSANSYISVADADAYFAERGNAAWAALDNAAKEVALIQGTEFIDLRWGQKLKGGQVSTEQALAFPRSGVYSAQGALYSADSVPRRVALACCEYALQSTAGALYGTPAAPSSGEVKKKKVQVGPVVTETEYFDGATGSVGMLSVPKADAYMKPFIKSRAGVMR